MKKNMIAENEICKAAKLTYFDFLNGLASKEEDFRCILYFHIRNIKESKKSEDIVLLNPKVFGKYPDIVIIHDSGTKSYIEIKQYIDFNKRSKNELNYDIKKLRKYKSDPKFEKGYLIHFYRNFQEWEELKRYNKDKSIKNIFFPNKKYESQVIKYLRKSKKNIINKSLSYLKGRGIVKDGIQEELKNEIKEHGDGWIPVNSYIERDEFLNGGYREVIKSLVKITKKDRKPIRFYSDCLSLSPSKFKYLNKVVKKGKKDLIDLIAILKFYELMRNGFIKRK